MILRRICLDPDTPGGGGGDAPDVAALQAEIDALKGQVTALTTERDALKKGGGDAEVRRLKSELRTAKTELATATGERDTLKARVSELEGTVTETTTKALLKDHGIDLDDLDYVLARYGKVEADADGHKPDLAEFLTEAKAGKAGWYTKIAGAASAASAAPAAPAPKPANPAPAAAAANPAASAPAAPAQPAAAAPAEPAAPAPKSPDAPAGKTVVTTKGGTGQYTAEQIRAMSPKEYAAHRAAIRAAAGVPLPN